LQQKISGTFLCGHGVYSVWPKISNQHRQHGDKLATVYKT